MNKLIALLSACALCFVVTGCGFFVSQTSGSSTSSSTDGLTIYAASPTNNIIDSTAATAYYSYAAFTYSDLTTSPAGGAIEASGSSGSFFFTPTSTPSSSSPLTVYWAFARNTDCPENAANPGTYGYANEVYTAYSQDPAVYCQAAPGFALSAGSINTDDWPYSLSMYLDEPIDTTYGTPQVGIYLEDATYVDSATVFSVSTDGLTVTFDTGTIPQPTTSTNIKYAIALVQINSDSSWEQFGGALLTTHYVPEEGCDPDCGP